MQVLVQVICTRGKSLRDTIAKDPRLGDDHLKVKEQKRQGRQHGWTKIRSTLPDRHGAINVEWDADISLLACCVVTRGKGKPNRIVSDLVYYLLRRHRRRIQSINIISRS